MKDIQINMSLNYCCNMTVFNYSLIIKYFNTENQKSDSQVSVLKSSQIEFESSKHEVRRLMDENDVLQAGFEEQEKLRQMAEKQMEDALVSLQHEREQRLALKREMDTLRSQDALSQLNSLAHSFLGMPGLPS